MAKIVRTYCGDCTIVAGSTSAGGVGRAGDGPKGSGRFDVALGEFLDAWHAIPNASLPDAVSWHAYPSRTNISYPPFPETNESLNDPRCSSTNVPNVSCFFAVADQPEQLRKVLHARSYLSAATPIWNTESGWNWNKTLLHGADGRGYADDTTALLRQAYLARQAILLANSGVAVNLWYEADHQCAGTLYGFGLDPERSPEMHQCRTDPVIPLGLTPAGRALNVVYSWLHGGSFTGPCEHSGTEWWCPVRDRVGRDGVLAWTTRWDKPERGQALRALHFRFAHTLDGVTAAIRPSEDVLLEPRPRLFNDVR